MTYIEGKTCVTVRSHEAGLLEIAGTFEEVSAKVWALLESLSGQPYTLDGGIELEMDSKSNHKTLVKPTIPNDIQRKMLVEATGDPTIYAQIQLARHLGMMPY